MDDLISRQDAIVALTEANLKRHMDSLNDCGRENRSAIRIIMNLPSAQRWIPCSERLPMLTGRYLTTSKWQGYLSRSIKYFNGYVFSKSNTELGDVIAWMPMPEPYKEGE